MMTTKTKATHDILADDAILAYVPGRTPESEGVMVRLVGESWEVEGGGSHPQSERPAAIAEAEALAANQWGAANER